MILMGIPNSFKWFNRSLTELNKLSYEEKKSILKKEELNIRHIIGESVPTLVFGKVAKNIKKQEIDCILSTKEVKEIITKNQLFSNEILLDFIENNKSY
jgi:DNA (cytosine-5)-methyltransferase 1